MLPKMHPVPGAILPPLPTPNLNPSNQLQAHRCNVTELQMWRHHTMWCQTMWRQNVASAENAASPHNVAPHNVAPKCGVTGKCGVTKQCGAKQCGAKMWRHGQMWRHQTMWRQTMWRQNVASRANVASPNNLAPNNVAPKCGVTGKCGVTTQCGAKQCGATMWRHRTMRRHHTVWRQRMRRHMSGKCVFIMCLQRQVEKCVLFCQHRGSIIGAFLLIQCLFHWIYPTIPVSPLGHLARMQVEILLASLGVRNLWREGNVFFQRQT